jgi:hypothetical protein
MRHEGSAYLGIKEALAAGVLEGIRAGLALVWYGGEE